MPLLKTYDLFISHAWRYGDEYLRLVNLLNNAADFRWRNYSAPEDDPLRNLDLSQVKNKSQITAAIERKISPVNAVIVISGMYANNREWMEKEIAIAQNYSKPIIAVKPWGNTNIPRYITEVAKVTVNWDTRSIVKAVRIYSL